MNHQSTIRQLGILLLGVLFPLQAMAGAVLLEDIAVPAGQDRR